MATPAGSKNEDKRLLGNMLKKKGPKAQACKAIIEEADLVSYCVRYSQQLL